jgi:hypothetical protein
MTPDFDDVTGPQDHEKPADSGDGGSTDPRDGSGDLASSAEVAAEGGQLADDQVVQEYVDPDIQSRLWLKAIVPLLQLRSHETDPSGRVQFAFDLMYIAACERIARILGSDVASDL